MSLLFADVFGSDEMRALFDDRALLQGWLDSEAALARAEADLGLIPAAAADEIARRASARLLDLDALRRGIAAADHPLVPAVWALAALCEGDAGGYVHWGATTQDVMDTGMVLQVRAGLALVQRRVAALVTVLTALADAERATLMPGRTHGQHAVPITFGLKVASWLDELVRHEERLEGLEPRLLVGQLAGAAGTLASLGEDGPAVRERFCAILGLGVPRISWHVARDNLAELAAVLAMLAATCARAASEVIQLQKTEVGELEERHEAGNIGSSTMPQKRNPMTAESIVAVARLVRANVPVALEGMGGEHERDMRSWQSEWHWVPETFVLLDAVLVQTLDVLSGLTLHRERMAENLGLTGGLLLAENVMLALGRELGRQRAHDLVHEVAMRAQTSDAPFRDLLLELPEVSAVLGEHELDRLLDGASYLGESGAAIDAVRRAATRHGA